jgi:hypothetical protein
MPWWHVFQHWLAYHTGSLNEPGVAPDGAFWGGIASDLGEVTLVGGLVAVYRKHNCHTRWCFRLGHHDLTDEASGVTYRLCRRHHPRHPGSRAPARRHIARIDQRNQGTR